MRGIALGASLPSYSEGRNNSRQPMEPNHTAPAVDKVPWGKGFQPGGCSQSGCWAGDVPGKEERGAAWDSVMLPPLAEYPVQVTHVMD